MDEIEIRAAFERLGDLLTQTRDLTPTGVQVAARDVTNLGAHIVLTLGRIATALEAVAQNTSVD